VIVAAAPSTAASSHEEHTMQEKQLYEQLQALTYILADEPDEPEVSDAASWPGSYRKVTAIYSMGFAAHLC
jgi:hypothetical protein